MLGHNVASVGRFVRKENLRSKRLSIVTGLGPSLGWQEA